MALKQFCFFSAFILLNCGIGVLANDAWVGVYAPVLTPHGDDGNISVVLLPQYGELLKVNGLSGILIAGTAGGSSTVSLGQRKKLVDAWIKVAKPLGLKVIVQVGVMPMPDILDLAIYAQLAGVDAILALPEVYYKPTTVELLVDYLKEISDAAPGLPLLYYDLPLYTGVNLDMTLVVELATKRIANFLGLKTDLNTALSVLNLLNLNQTVFVANGISLPSGALIGLKSFINTESAVFPKDVMDAYKNGVAGNVNETRKLQVKITALHLALTLHGELGPSALVALKLTTGLDLGDTLPPLPPLSNLQKLALKKDLINAGVEIKDVNVGVAVGL